MLRKHPLYFFLLVSILVSAAAPVAIRFSGTSLDVMDAIAQELQNGHAEGVTAYFGESTEVAVLDKGGSYSREQALAVLQNFFAQNKVIAFYLLEKGKNMDGRFCIGTLNCRSGNFRVYYSLRAKNNIFVIETFNIEKQ